jgi:hypothetical protein
MNSLAVRKEIIEISDLRSRIPDEDFCFELVITEARRPPWRARHVSPPVVSPVRKMIKRLVGSIIIKNSRTQELKNSRTLEL